MDNTYTFAYHNAQITLARRTNRHALLIDRIMLLLSDVRETPEGRVDSSYQRVFAGMLVQTQSVEGDLGFELVSPVALAEDIQAAYRRFLDGDGRLGDAYYEALKAVNAPLVPRALLPADMLSEDERKNSPGTGKSGDESSVPSSGTSRTKKPANPA